MSRWMREVAREEMGFGKELEGRIIHYLVLKERVGVYIYQDLDGRWNAVGTRRGGSDFQVLMSHLELLEDVKREAESYL